MKDDQLSKQFYEIFRKDKLWKIFAEGDPKLAFFIKKVAVSDQILKFFDHRSVADIVSNIDRLAWLDSLDVLGRSGRFRTVLADRELCNEILNTLNVKWNVVAKKRAAQFLQLLSGRATAPISDFEEAINQIKAVAKSAELYRRKDELFAFQPFSDFVNQPDNAKALYGKLKPLYKKVENNDVLAHRMDWVLEKLAPLAYGGQFAPSYTAEQFEATMFELSDEFLLTAFSNSPGFQDYLNSVAGATHALSIAQRISAPKKMQVVLEVSLARELILKASNSRWPTKVSSNDHIVELLKSSRKSKLLLEALAPNKKKVVSRLPSLYEKIENSSTNVAAGDYMIPEHLLAYLIMFAAGVAPIYLFIIQIKSN